MDEGLGIPGFEDARLIGRGGFGAVFRVRQPKLDREVAIKVLDVVGVDEQLRRRFDREQRVMGSLSSHPGIVTLFDTGYTDAGRPYLVMELMTGGSLRDRLDAKGPMPWREAAAVILTITDAVAQAHQQGVLHRDIKPDNILISAFGEAKLTDFGIATLLEGTVTSTTSISATLEYAAPEILAGEIATPAADVYSLAATLYALLAGHSAFRGNRDESMLALLNRVLTTSPPDLRSQGIPEPLCQLIDACLAKDRTSRPQTATEFADQLRDAVRRAELADATGPGIAALGAIRISGPVLVVPGHDPGPAPHLTPTEIVPKTPHTTPVESTTREATPKRTGRTLAIAAAITILGATATTTTILLRNGNGDTTTTIAESVTVWTGQTSWRSFPTATTTPTTPTTAGTTTVAIGGDTEIAITQASEIPYSRIDLTDETIVSCAVTGQRSLPDGSTVDTQECRGEVHYNMPAFHIMQGWRRDEGVSVDEMLEQGSFATLFIDGAEQDPTGYVAYDEAGDAVASEFWVVEGLLAAHELRVEWFAQGELVKESAVTAHFLPYPYLGNVFEETVSCTQRNYVETCSGDLTFGSPAFHVWGQWFARDPNTSVSEMADQGYGTKLLIDGVEKAPAGYVGGSTSRYGSLYVVSPDIPNFVEYWLIDGMSGTHTLEFRASDPDRGVFRISVLTVSFP